MPVGQAYILQVFISGGVGEVKVFQEGQQVNF